MIFSEYSVNKAVIDGCDIMAVAINSKMLLKEA